MNGEYMSHQKKECYIHNHQINFVSECMLQPSISSHYASFSTMFSTYMALQTKNNMTSISMEIWMTVPIINMTVSTYRKAMLYTTMN